MNVEHNDSGIVGLGGPRNSLINVVAPYLYREQELQPPEARGPVLFPVSAVPCADPLSIQELSSFTPAAEGKRLSC